MFVQIVSSLEALISEDVLLFYIFLVDIASMMPSKSFSYNVRSEILYLVLLERNSGEDDNLLFVPQVKKIIYYAMRDALEELKMTSQ